MRPSPTELPHRGEPVYLDSSDSEPGKDGPAGLSEALDAAELESLILNMDASLRVYSRPHFFSWTQGLLQGLIKHEVLICALRNGEPRALRVDTFSTNIQDPGLFSDLFLRDPAGVSSFIKAWENGRFRPVIGEAGPDGALVRGMLAREFEQMGATQLFAHGTHDADGQMASLFIFGCAPGTIGPRQTYLGQLAIPFLHLAWLRAQMTGRAKGIDGLKLTVANNITPREQEILRWIYLGKSNLEIGVILSISPLTVKNHVQKILRKLNVVNRAQAVGKALELHVLNP